MSVPPDFLLLEYFAICPHKDMAMNQPKAETLTLLQIVNHILSQHPELAAPVQELAIQAGGFSYDFHKNGEYELLSKLQELKPLCIFDVGANVGEWTRIALEKFPAATIHSFELSSATFNTLKENVRDPRARLNNFGLSDREGSFDYKDYGRNAGVNTLLLQAVYHDAHAPHRILQGSLRRGDDYCRDAGIENIDFLKIDVEGAEHMVLEGFADMLAKKAIRAVQFEYGYVNGDSKFLMRDFYEFFRKYGYVVGRVVKGPIVFRDWTYKDNDFMSGPNYVAIREDDLALGNRLSN
jgi:FkbM family methyltransferase